ncbi:DUF5694 domain-containing protein [Thalassotalea mangrovi]|uniref:TraB/GumN family protein n=1 Tax=Thalassotalea mangrovi TaxID=2572245 RepID=A0A4U1B246_9GAMM|nr:DUF5694 domain-containing protein [Thalassotalea mangrovi]TKB43647.1 hypothetical protein E8M12_14345 [Thalassotalea mangrovi]
MKQIYIMFLGFIALSALLKTAQAEEFTPENWKDRVHGPLAQVAVLGSPHLSKYGEKFKVESLNSVLNNLERFKPNIITIEAISGPQCEYIRQYSSEYPDVFKNYCWDNHDALKATGLTIAQAVSEANRILQEWQQTPEVQPTAAQRRYLAAVFLAANDRYSAQVQWLYLAPEDRHKDRIINQDLLSILNRENGAYNENYEIGVNLAVRLGLQRVYSIDDHTADVIQTHAGKGFEPAILDVWSNLKVTPIKEEQKIADGTADADDLLSIYRESNKLQSLMPAIEGDFGAGLKHDTPELFGRQYVAWWETRNLRMTANIRSAFANNPGAKVLSIVGSSHKPYIESYLRRMHDVEIVNTSSLLK